MEIKIKYAEPAEYIPKELRRLYKLGEYAEPKQEQQPRTKATGSLNINMGLLASFYGEKDSLRFICFIYGSLC